MPIPTFAIGPAASLLRSWHQSRRKVKLTVHKAFAVGPIASIGGGPIIAVESENYYITVTNASASRDIVVTHIWLDTSPPVQVYDRDLPVRLRYGDPWETAIPVSSVPDDVADVEWLARCQITPDDKVIKSKPRRNVPPFGAVPRGTG